MIPFFPYPAAKGKKAVAIGTFDGVHSGHMAVIETLKTRAGKKKLRPTVITFDRHPLNIIAPGRVPKMLATVCQRDNLLRQEGVDTIFIRFDENVAAVTVRDWMRWLHDSLEVRMIIVGYDNTFGCDGLEMDVAGYTAIGKELGIEIIEAPYVAGTSSSLVRKALDEGDVRKAADMLGRRPSLSGPVVHGQALGRTIGWPTANIVPDPRTAVPAPGVYAAFAILPDGRKFPAIVNIGRRPTVGESLPLTIEAHLDNWEGSLYGLDITLEFAERIRGERKFESTDQLRQAIADDHDKAMIILDQEVKHDIP